jgi:hypothetical protein
MAMFQSHHLLITQGGTTMDLGREARVEWLCCNMHQLVPKTLSNQIMRKSHRRGVIIIRAVEVVSNQFKKKGILVAIKAWIS